MGKSELYLFLEKTGPGILPDGTLTVVMGNEAADLDSIASSILLAYYLFLKDPRCKPKALIPIPRKDFRLRTEAVFLFKEVGIDESVLNFAEDMDLHSLAWAKRLRLVLVDHNRLSAPHGELEKSISLILDHHVDEGRYPSTAMTDIRPVASTATLVAENFLKGAKDRIDGSVATLLLGTILLDTVNLDPEAHRATEADSAAADKLVQLTEWDTQALFHKLQSEKCKVSALSSHDLLRKDYKAWQMGGVKCGISSIPISAEEWKKRDPNLEKTFRQYAAERELDALLTMNAFSRPAFTRQLGLYTRDQKLRERLIHFLNNSELDLERLDVTSEDDGVIFYHQKNPALSRKRLQPLFNGFFQDQSGLSYKE